MCTWLAAPQACTYVHMYIFGTSQESGLAQFGIQNICICLETHIRRIMYNWGKCYTSTSHTSHSGAGQIHGNILHYVMDKGVHMRCKHPVNARTCI